MASNVRPAPTSAQASPGRAGWRRALNVVLVLGFLVASVSAQAVGLTPVAIVLLFAALLAIAPLVNPASGI